MKDECGNAISYPISNLTPLAWKSVLSICIHNKYRTSFFRV